MSAAIDLFHRIPETVGAIQTGQERFALQADILDALFTPLVSYHRDEVHELRRKNFALTGKPHEQFVFRGGLYPSLDDAFSFDREHARFVANTRGNSVHTVSSEFLHLDLVDDMLLLVNDLEDASRQFDAARNHLSAALLPAVTIIDVRAILAPCVHPILDSFMDRCPIFTHCTDDGHLSGFAPGQLDEILRRGAEGIDAMETRFALNLLF